MGLIEQSTKRTGFKGALLKAGWANFFHFQACSQQAPSYLLTGEATPALEGRRRQLPAPPAPLRSAQARGVARAAEAACRLPWPSGT
jgi:hypothetical protein